MGEWPASSCSKARLPLICDIVCAGIFDPNKGTVMDRKLVTILAADVVGYSTLMEQDEQGTFERLRTGRRELFEPEIARHHGRIFKLMGDGLAQFGSVAWNAGRGTCHNGDSRQGGAAREVAFLPH
jgi:class 3 adenylate cyclase